MILGIDLSKAYFDVTFIDSQGQKQHGRFDNTEKGFKQLTKWLKKRGAQAELHACMEATNIYWEAIAQYLHDLGYQVSVVNPARIKGFAMSQLRRNKTDKLDSDVIADFCQALVPKTWTPPTTEQRKLRSLVRHRDALIKTRTQQKNRLASCIDDDVCRSLQTLIHTLDSEIEQMDAQIDDFIDQQPALREQYALLVSIQGIGPVAAHKLMSEMYDLADYEAAPAAAADAGLSPAIFESGDTVRRRSKMTKVGKKSVRAALYWPAITAIQHNPKVRELAQRLEAKHKDKKVIIGAAMRKLLHIAYGVLKNKTPFDPNWETQRAPA
jgi:transposase